MEEQNSPKDVQEEEQLSEKAKGTAEKIWGATVKTFHLASFRANQYKRIAQIKIDLASLHKKIATAYADMGKLIDEKREAGEIDVMNTVEVRDLLQKLDSLKSAVATLEAEKEAIKAEIPPPEEEEKPEDHKH